MVDLVSALVAGGVAIMVSTVSVVAASRQQRRHLDNQIVQQENRLRGDFRLQEDRLRMELRTVFMAEEAIRTLLESDRWQKRSFEEIRKRLGGFEDDDLRQLLVRAGAVRFFGSDDKELWGLRSRNLDELR